ncbi:MAG TPA: FixH family protein [Bacteroidia bacterium]|nr:FixH family protein [Bacteroidia bacterium]
MSKKKVELWPIGIIAAFAVFISGILIAVTIMMRNDVPLTSKDYYAKEIAYQEQLDKSSRGLSPAQKPVIQQLAATEALQITFPGHSSPVKPTGKITFFRPSDPTKDFAIDLGTDASGMQWVSMRDRVKGLWLVQIEWTESGTEYYYEEQILI